MSVAVRHWDGGFENIYDEFRGGIAYAFAEPVLNARWNNALDRRHGHVATLQATAVLDGITYLVFSPDVAIKATRTPSTASEYTTSAVELRVGVQSNF